MSLSKGLYITLNAEKIVFFQKVQLYADANSEFALVTWIDDKGVFPKTLIMGEQFYNFIRLGRV